jgi:hypothetical protein
MEPLTVVHGFDKGSDGASGLAQIAIAASVDLFLLQGFHEAFGLGVVVRIANAAHTGLDIIRRQDFRVLGASVLDAAIRMMDQGASCRLSRCDGHHQRGNG